MINLVLVNVSCICHLNSSLLEHISSRRVSAHSKMKFDNILSEINGFGKFQIRHVLIQFLSRITLPCHFLLNNFMSAVPAHYCNISALDDGDVFRSLTQEQKLAVGIPAEQQGVLSSCQMFSQPQYGNLSDWNSSEDTVIVQCQNGWVCDNSTF